MITMTLGIDDDADDDDDDGDDSSTGIIRRFYFCTRSNPDAPPRADADA